jgi:hypothetical protein
MNGQPTADSAEACTIILTIDSYQRLEDPLTHFFAEEELTIEGEDGFPQQ